MAVAKKRAPSTNGEVSTGVPESPDSQIIVPAIQVKILPVTIVGTSPLIVNAWSHKARQMMLDKQTGKAKKAREPKNPEADYNASRYISTEGWDGIPSTGVKGCLVNACRGVDGLAMTVAKRLLFVHSQGKTKDGQELVRIHGEPKMLESMVRLESGVADIRFRAVYEEWHMDLEIEFLANAISPEQVANLLELAGHIEGLCEHRPGSPKSNTGGNGRFRIKRNEA